MLGIRTRIFRGDLLISINLSEIQSVFFDIDDTFSSHGKITADAYSSLWDLSRAGLRLIPVTGRPAGWCDHIARFWPVDAVVGENGAFVMFVQEGRMRRKETSGLSFDRLHVQSRLGELVDSLKKKFPELRLASDQAYRDYDVAFDFAEDCHPPWSSERVNDLKRACESMGATAKVSSIHLNAWFGDFDKIKGIELALRVFGELDAQESLTSRHLSKSIYLGDSPNDEPCFKLFPCSVGVANIRPFLEQMRHHPKILTSAESGSGFKEFADTLLAARSLGSSQGSVR